MYIAPRFDAPPFITENSASQPVKRPAPMVPIPRLESFEAFGAQLRRQVAACVAARERSVVMVVAANTEASGVRRSELLAAVGLRLRGSVRATDLVVRVGDEFGVFLYGDAAPHAARIRERLRVTLRGGYGFDEAMLMVQPRFGMMAHPGNAISGAAWVLGAVLEMGAEAADLRSATQPDATAGPAAALPRWESWSTRQDAVRDRPLSRR